ncbi:MAG: hemolysin III family protein [Planctomycetota bacterium]
MLQIRSWPGFYEPFNSLSHLVGAAVFLVLGVRLLRASRGDRLHKWFFGVFAFTSVLLLSMSGVFHMLEEGSTGRAVLGRLDKAAIFALIAGTHTPVQGLFFRGGARWGVIAIMWTLAVTGITLFSIFYESLPHGLGTGMYLLMGWIAGIAGLVAWRRERRARIGLLVLGGLFYSAGAILLGLEWPVIVPPSFGPHELWHVAVLIAMALHWRFMFWNAQRACRGTPSSPTG